MTLLLEKEEINIAENANCMEVLKEHLSGKKFKACLAAKIALTTGEEVLIDLSEKIPSNAKNIIPITADDAEGLEILRHSTAHIMADAVQKLFPGTKVTIGPSIANGFYYDFEAKSPFTPEDLEKIEAKMSQIIAEGLSFERSEISKEEAINIFSEMGEIYKVEIISEIDAPTVSLYKSGEFLDLCRGPHIPNTNFVKAFKLMSVAGAYWRGDEKNAMLSRIYGTAFADEKALKAYLNQLEEAKKRDHRKLGKELGLFAFHEDVAPGMPFFLPKGMMVKAILEDFLRKEHLKRGYELVQGPQILRKELWEKSGHYEHYRQNMYFTHIEEDVHGVKPMNCVGHLLMYNNSLHSYRELPVRLFELGIVHRHEMSGALHGLLRVRQFMQDDAHIICTPEQLEEEIIGVMNLSADLMNLFGFEYKLFISTRPEDSIGSDEAWELSTKALISAVQKENKEYQINEGDGAFYGPKIDIKVTDAIGREWQLSTIQVDFNLPERFNLEYVGADGARHRPVMVHRAILGSLERFIGVLTEHYAGAFPTWLAPVQAKVLNVTDVQLEHTKKVVDYLKANGLRVEADTRNEKLGFKVREAQLAKIPFILVVGDKEVEENGVNIRLRTGENLGLQNIEETIKIIREDSNKPFKTGGMSYSFA